MPIPAWIVTSHALMRRAQAEGLRPDDPNFIQERERLRALILEEIEQARPLARGQNIFMHPMRLRGHDGAEYRLYQGPQTLCYIAIGRTVLTVIPPDDRQLETLAQLGELPNVGPPRRTLTRPPPPWIPKRPPPPAPTATGVKALPEPVQVPTWIRKPGTRLQLLIDHLHLPGDAKDRDDAYLLHRWASHVGKRRLALIVCSETLLSATRNILGRLGAPTPVILFAKHPRPNEDQPYHPGPELRAWWEELDTQGAAGRSDFAFFLSPGDARRFRSVLWPRQAGFPPDEGPMPIHPGTVCHLRWDFNEERLIASPHKR